MKFRRGRKDEECFRTHRSTGLRPAQDKVESLWLRQKHRSRDQVSIDLEGLGGETSSRGLTLDRGGLFLHDPDGRS